MRKTGPLDDALVAIQAARHELGRLVIQCPLDAPEADKQLALRLAEAFIHVKGEIDKKAARRARYNAGDLSGASND